MLVLTGQGSTDRLHKESHQIMDVVSMFRPVTKWATTILQPGQPSRRSCARPCDSRAPRNRAPAHRAARGRRRHGREQPPMIRGVSAAPVPDDKIVDQAFEMLKQAKRPIIIAGNGCIRRRASKQLRLFCEKTGIGVVSTFMAKGCVDMDEGLLPVHGRARQQGSVSMAIDDADLVVTLGFDMVEYHPELWNPQGDKKHTCTPTSCRRRSTSNYHPETELIGDLAHTLWMLNERVDEHGLRTTTSDYKVSACRHGRGLRRAQGRRHERRYQATESTLGCAPGDGSRRRAALGRRRPQDVDRAPLPVPRTEHLPDPERLLLDGLRVARRDCGGARASRTGGFSPSVAMPVFS